MANLVRMYSTFNCASVKSLLNWKLCCKIAENPLANFRFNVKWFNYIKYKEKLNPRKPLSLYVKISLGFSACVGLKIFSNNIVHCEKCLDKGTRLVGTENFNTEKELSFNWKTFFRLLKPYWVELIGAVLAALICALLNVQIPRALGTVVDIISKASVGSDTFLEDIKKPVLNMVTYYLIQSLFTFFYISFLANVGEGIAKTMKIEMFSSIMNQDIAFFDKNRTGEILNRLTIDIQDFKSSFKMIISEGLRNSTQIIGCSISLLLISPLMSSVLLVVLPAVVIGGTFVGSLLRELSCQAKAQSTKVAVVAEEAISNIRTVRSFAMEDLENKIVGDQAELCRKLNVKLGYGIALFQTGTILFLNGIVLGTLSLGGYMMTTGSLTAGDLMAFFVAAQLLQRSFTQMSLLFGIYIKGKHAGSRVFEIIDLPRGQTIKDGRKIPFHSFIPSVEFKNVIFAYPSRPKMDVLKNVSLKIPVGKTVAIVGSSGSGKSTLAWLLERFYDVDHGAVLVGEEDVKNLNSSWLRGQVIGFISQEPILFATTILENIRYGKPNATDEEVIEAAKIANADSFIREFPDGYQTVVGERGVSVSGGQKQRIAIARALLKNPSILILDEATSALDSESEKAVQHALDTVTKSRTTIVIAHRLSTVRNADLIVVLHNGIIVESGTHHELLEKNGMYAALVAQQVEDK